MTAPATSDMATEAALCVCALALLNVAFDVFDDDDGVVHHRSCRQGDAKQGKSIDRESQHLHEGESSDQRNWNRHRRYNGCCRHPCQENKDDEDDQDDGLDERGEHVPDRFAHGYPLVSKAF